MSIVYTSLEVLEGTYLNIQHTESPEAQCTYFNLLDILSGGEGSKVSYTKVGWLPWYNLFKHPHP